MYKIDSIKTKIGIPENYKDYYVFQENTWQKKLPIRLHKGLKEIKPYSLLLFENRIVSLFVNLTSSDNTKKFELFKKIWNLGGCPIIFLFSEDTVDIYNGFSFDTKKYIFDELKLGKKQITKDNIKTELSIWDLISGKGFDRLPAYKTSIDEQLLRNLENTKKILVKEGLDNTYAQNLIGRLLFSRFLLDRNVKVESKYFEDKTSFLTLIKNKKLLYEYFEYLKVTFNGDLFPVGKDEFSQVTGRHLEYLFELFSGSDINGSGNTIQESLFDIYDFNIIPIEMISEVYERFIGKVEQKKRSAYYTPSFLVDYILEKTVKPHLNSNDTCKVFDASCGSGIFLVESLRAIIEKNLNNNRTIEKDKLKKLLVDNIFGVDVDPDAVNLTVFSLCLTLLDYVDSKDITKFRFPTLLDNNLFIADYFDTSHSFNQKIKNIDFILGNPPWGSDKESVNPHIKYFTDNNIPVSDKQIAQTFIVRSKDFSIKTTECALVLPSKPVLYNHNAKKFREYFLINFALKEILELSPVRHRIFSKADAPTAIAFFKYSHRVNTENNDVLHTSIKPNIFLERLKLIAIEKNDIKQVKQGFFIKFDYLWKILLYGNVLDFYLIKRLKEEYDSLNDVIQKNNLNFAQGFQVGGGDQNDGTHLLGKFFLDTKKKLLKKFYIDVSSCKKWNKKILHRPRTKDVYNPPYVLLKKGFSRQNFLLVSAYTENEFVFTDSVTAIRGTEKNILKSIAGCLNSFFSSYHLLLQGSSAGVERELGHNEEDRFTIPIVLNQEIADKVDKIQSLYKEKNNRIMHAETLESQIADEEKVLNETILDSFRLTTPEKSLIDYAITITIPQINNQEAPIANASEKQLEKYAKIFADHFGKRWNKEPTFFEIDIYYNEYIAGMNFKVVKQKPHQIINIKQENAGDLLKLIKIGEEKITDVFFKQRDIRGFNKTSFYIVKPNQYKNWHEAMAYSDLSEFVDAMLKAETSTGNK